MMSNEEIEAQTAAIVNAQSTMIRRQVAGDMDDWLMDVHGFDGDCLRVYSEMIVPADMSSRNAFAAGFLIALTLVDNRELQP